MPQTQVTSKRNAADRFQASLLATVSCIAIVLGMSGCSQQHHTVESKPAEPALPASATPSPANASTVPGTSEPAHTSMENAHHQDSRAHQDHDSKHGGTFFMALDQKHHLEGVLSQPGIFRVYLYNEHTQPLGRKELATADAKVIWGPQGNALETAMQLSIDGLTLEATAPAKVAFPTELTLLIRFPGATAGTRPELFTFPFKEFTHDAAPLKH